LTVLTVLKSPSPTQKTMKMSLPMSSCSPTSWSSATMAVFSVKMLVWFSSWAWS
jgi:hypothetical protein